MRQQPFSILLQENPVVRFSCPCEAPCPAIFISEDVFVQTGFATEILASANLGIDWIHPPDHEPPFRSLKTDEEDPGLRFRFLHGRREWHWHWVMLRQRRSMRGEERIGTTRRKDVERGKGRRRQSARPKSSPLLPLAEKPIRGEIRIVREPAKTALDT